MAKTNGAQDWLDPTQLPDADRALHSAPLAAYQSILIGHGFGCQPVNRGQRGRRLEAGACVWSDNRERQDPNQRSRRVEANASSSAASSREGPTSRAVGAGPPRKLASTLPTIPPPNSM
jgi:hypothetical protein